MPRGGRDNSRDHGPTPSRRGNAVFPRSEPPDQIETSEEANEKLELLVDELNQAKAEIGESFADDSALSAALDQAAASIWEAINRIEDLEGSKRPEGQALTVARTALKRYADIDEGGAIGVKAELALDGDLDSAMATLSYYRHRPDVDSAEAEEALRRCRELLGV